MRHLGWLFLLLPLATGASASAETLSVAKLAHNESIVIVRTATRESGERLGRVYLLEAKEGRVLSAYDQPTWVRTHKQAEARRTIGATYLSGYDTIGLDAWLTWLRRKYSGDCPHIEELVIGYYRDDKKIGEERFRDATCTMLFFAYENGKMSVDESRAPADFPIDLFRAMVPPHTLEQRILEEAKAAAEKG